MKISIKRAIKRLFIRNKNLPFFWKSVDEKLKVKVCVERCTALTKIDFVNLTENDYKSLIQTCKDQQKLLEKK